MTSPLLSFQLYTARASDSLDTQLAELAAMGITNVEPFGELYADLDGLHSILAQHNMTALSGHFDLEMLEAEPARAIEIARRLGMKTIIAPWLEPEDRPVDLAGWQALAARLLAVGDQMRAGGFIFAWHNHEFEFEPLPCGTMPIEVIMNEAGCALELDVAWVVRAGGDPLMWIERYAERIIAVHVKDIAPEGQNLDQDGWTNVGQGIVDWPAVWAMLPKTGARLAILEHDEPKDWLDFATQSSAAVRQLDGVAV
ncbi:sugar phosphate isomerase/epimerase (plasmid) [Thioclava sp. 'Guangxiensis']|uniref:sugar phosphate isomerase/epimerase family protein n=1 Tax=Thioclava sp. 'Guangxiensis' TaxID=3149044 RepID=UPI0032C45287